MGLPIPRPFTINKLLKYFRTGKMPKGTRPPESLRHVAENILHLKYPSADNVYLVVNRIERSRSPIVPLYAEAHVEFRIIDDVNRAWEIINTPYGETFYACGDASFTFTSAMTLTENLQEFADFMLAPSHPPRGPHPLENPYYQAVLQIYREFCDQLFANENYKTCIKGISLEPNDEKLFSESEEELKSPEEWMIIVIFKQESKETPKLPESFKGIKIKAQK